MNKEIILKEIRDQGSITSSALSKKYKISKQALNKYFRSLIISGDIIKEGSTRNSKYLLNTNNLQQKSSQIIKLEKNTYGLQEDLVFDELQIKTNLSKHLHKNVISILNYAFTEMLNNAIDHSGAKKARILFKIDTDSIEFVIADSGIGIFNNVMNKFKLKNEYEALEHVLKGKQTTLPDRHSGQGIFFTSRIADLMHIESHKIKIIFNNKKNDIFVGECRQVRGTRITFMIAKRSKRQIKKIFDQYANEEYDFDRADYKIKLVTNREYLSRSQAKRIVTGIDKYKKIIFDFKDITFVGQAFVHEIFIVYQRQNPSIEITFINANQAIASMILRALRETKK
jgi:anti-sigma regulatory factor (Ser/Thr protein kinase)